MSKRPNPDYVDRCIDFISSRRRRCIADLTLGAIIIGGLTVSSLLPADAEMADGTWIKSRAELAQNSQPCKENPVRLETGAAYSSKKASLWDCLRS